ncbi:MAG: HupE/UreJ family protein [Deltaproteobacteria bacterium]|nr:HupE/UreJ family protein [Deltaproteobacteria bacterium]
MTTLAALRPRAFFGWLAAVALLLPVAAAAHDRTTSHSTWSITGRRAYVTVRLTRLDVSRFPWAAGAGAELDRLLGAYLSTRLELRAGDALCPLSDGPRPLAAAPGRVLYEWQVSCPESGSLQVRSRLLLDVSAAHLHFARVSRDGALALERVLSEREPAWPLPEPAPGDRVAAGATSLAGYLGLGIEHILSGYDHLAFVLALLLLGGALGEVARVVTGFTVAHSITLALTVLGYARPEPAPVEALIGLSIALVAAENVWLAGARGRTLPAVTASLLLLLAGLAALGHGRIPAVTLAGLALFSACYFGLLARAARPASLRWAIAFIFGLVHGFGFASVLIEAGLPTERLVQALFGFNAGVEVGQLAVIALVWPVLRRLARQGDGARLAVLHYGSAGVLALGVFWFISRAFG